MTFWLQLHLFCSKLTFRMLMILIEMKLLTFIILSQMFYCRSKSFEYLNSPKFHFVKSQKLSVLCSKKLLNQSANKDFSKSLK